MKEKQGLVKLLFVIASVICLTPYVNSPVALVAGFLMAWYFGNPFKAKSGKAVSKLLKISVVGLGFGMNLNETLNAGKEGFSLTVLSITVTLVLGFIIGKAIGLDKKISHLISSGTAICGGSAIAAVSSVINAKEKQMSIALGVVFFLNSVALLLFPAIGHMLHLTQNQFGLWAAIAIHDTSSVVGAALAYGDEALKVATTVKLARALWIIPVSLLSMVLFRNKTGKFSIPWFIFFFMVAIVANSFLNIPEMITSTITTISKRSLVLTLFWIGAGLSIDSIKESGFKPMVIGVSLWLVISVLSLVFITL